MTKKFCCDKFSYYGSGENTMGPNIRIIKYEGIIREKMLLLNPNADNKGFVNNEPNGKSIYYFDDGKLESVHYKKNSKITEESTFYDSNGLIRKYIMYNDIGEPYFIISFDEKGVREFNGATIKEIYQSRFSNKEEFFKVGDVLRYSYVLANIPKAKRNFKIVNMTVDDFKVKRTIKHLPPTQIEVEEVLTKIGKNTIRAVVRYEFEDKITPPINDTISFDIYVNKK